MSQDPRSENIYITGQLHVWLKTFANQFLLQIKSKIGGEEDMKMRFSD